MTTAWPWIALAALGAYHGLNPAMGWLFAVALGLYRKQRSAVLLALVPIAIGHFLSIAIVAGAFLAAGAVVDPVSLERLAGAVLIGWAGYHALYGHHGRVRFGMQTGLVGLAAWSFLMASAHGAGLMLIPALMPICFAGAASTFQPDSVQLAFAGVLVHSATMLSVTAVIAIAVYDWVGLNILRSSWINFDLLWTLALCATGALLLFG